MDYTNDWSPHADRRQVTSGEEDEAEAEDEAEEAEELLDLVNDAVMLGYLCANLEAERKQAARKGPPQAKERTLCGSLKGRRSQEGTSRIRKMANIWESSCVELPGWRQVYVAVKNCGENYTRCASKGN
jgi:hypothetical protein